MSEEQIIELLKLLENTDDSDLKVIISYLQYLNNQLYPCKPSSYLLEEEC